MKLKKCLYLFLLALWFIGMVSGVGYAIYYKEGAVIIAGLIIGIAYGIPTVKKIWNKFNE